MGAVTLGQLPALLERTGVTLSEAERAVRGLLASVTDSPQFEAAEMLMAAYGVDKSAILLGGKLPPDAEKREALLGMVRRRLGREPLQYILGRWDFFGRPFYVGEGVLIPRPDTEVLMEQVLLGLQDIRSPRVLELCGGSGRLAVTLSLERPDAEVWSVEKSEDAYRYLTRNNEALGAGVRPVLGDAFDTDSVEGDFDCILCNPPYLSAKDMAELEPELSYEPEMALYGDRDGLYFYRRLTSLWTPRLKKGGLFAYEIGVGQETAVSRLMEEAGLNTICQTRDYSGIMRVVTARKP